MYSSYFEYSRFLFPVQICIVLFCFVIHFALFYVRICTLVYINAQCAKEKAFETENLKCAILTADC